MKQSKVLKIKSKLHPSAAIVINFCIILVKTTFFATLVKLVSVYVYVYV